MSTTMAPNAQPHRIHIISSSPENTRETTVRTISDDSSAPMQAQESNNDTKTTNTAESPGPTTPQNSSGNIDEASAGQSEEEEAQQQPSSSRRIHPVVAKTLTSPLQNLRKRIRRRRARSAPPPKVRPLIEEHFQFDREDKRVVLPGVPRHGEDLDRDTHDLVNLVVLIPIVALNVMNWNWDVILNFKAKTAADAWTGEWFDLFFACTLAYFIFDLLWILLIPTCVKSPATIIQHHIVTMLYMGIPYYQPEMRWAMGVCMSVEVNTWFLIARRVFNKQGFSPWVIDISFFSVRIKFISVGFYLTWIGIRCILYPFLWVWLLQRWQTTSLKQGTVWNIDAIAPVLHSSFCILNLKWTYDLLMSKIRYYRRRARGIKGREKLSKGL